MKYIQYLTVLGLLLLIVVQGAYASEGRVELREQVQEMRQEHLQTRQQLREDVRDSVKEFRNARKEEADELRQGVRDELKDSTTAAQRRAIVEDAVQKRNELKEASVAARHSLWDTIRGERSTLRTEQQQERASLFDKFKSLFSPWMH